MTSPSFAGTPAAPPPPARGLFGLHQLPNLICVLRVVAVFWALAALGELHRTEGEWSAAAIAVIVVAALTDRLDGFLAKRYGWSSALGAVLDQISDKLVTLALFSFLVVFGAFPAWALALLVLRELFVTCLRIAANLERIAIRTSQAGRFKTFTQQVAVLLIFLHWAYPAAALGPFTLAQCLLWGGWLAFWAIMLALGRRGFAAFQRIYTAERVDPRSGETSRARADLVLVYLTIAAMALPLDIAGWAVVLVITLGTGVTYFEAYLWARRSAERRTAAGTRNVALSFLASTVLSVGLAVALVRWPSLPVMWTLIAALSVLWTVLLSVSYRTDPTTSATQAASSAASGGGGGGAA